jgi:peptide subunit release factor 1 (eRF1)
MTQTLHTARHILERTGEHPVLSLYFDLDPAEFATPPARSSQISSLVDEAKAEIDQTEQGLSHDDRKTLVQDLERVRSFLESDEAPVSGARALAVFCSGQDQLFEAVRLYEPALPRVVIARQPFLEPLVAASGESGWCVCLVNRSTARILAGNAPRLWERGELDDDVHGRHTQGGWSQARYERSVDTEAERHLQHVADELRRRWEREPFHTLVLGGPEETVAELRRKLHGDLHPTLAEERLSLDVQNASEDEVRASLVPLLERRRHEFEERALEQIRAAQGGGAANAVTGVQAVTLALSERRVEKLLLSPDFHRAGGRCPSCGILVVGEVDSCPADGTAVRHLDDLREAAIESALVQDAQVIVFEEAPPETHLRQGIGAVLRF